MLYALSERSHMCKRSARTMQSTTAGNGTGGMAFALVALSPVPVSTRHLSTKEFIYETRPYRRCARGPYRGWRDLRANPSCEYDRRQRPALAGQGVRTSGQHVQL